MYCGADEPGAADGDGEFDCEEDGGVAWEEEVEGGAGEL